jgi:internalin A
MASKGSRLVWPPVTEAMLAPFEPECRSVKLLWPLSDSEAERLADVMRLRPDLKLSVNPPGDANLPHLDFLRFFPWVEWLYVYALSLRDLTGIAHLSRLRHLDVGGSKYKLSAAPLAALASSLRHLSLEGPVSRVEALSELTELRTLTLRSVSMPDLSVLRPMADLQGLDLKLGGTRDLSLLPSFSRLQYFEAWMIRGLSDLSPLAEVTSLEELYLEALKHVTKLPSLQKLTRLRRITLSTMKGLTDLSVLLTAPALEELALVADHLAPEQVTQLAAHPALKKASIGMGSDWKNAAVAAGLPLPPINSPSLYLALKRDQGMTD